MIQNKEDNISGCAYRVGFNDVKYFRSCFKKQFGVNPSQLVEKKIPPIKQPPARKLIQIQVTEKQDADKVIAQLQNGDRKDNFRRISAILYGSDITENIYAAHKLFITSWKNKRDDNYQAIVAIIRKILDND